MELTEVLGLFREANRMVKNRKTNGYTRTLSYLVGLQYRIFQLTAEINRFNRIPDGDYTAFDNRIKELGGDIYWYLSQMWNEVHLKSKDDHNHPYFKSEIKLTKEDLEKRYCAYHLLDHDDLDEVDYSGAMNNVYYQCLDIDNLVKLSISPVMYLITKAINNPNQKEEDDGAPQVWMRSHIDPLVYAIFNKITVLIALVGFTVDDCLSAMVRAIQARG
jgi:hypothetical protein|nr:MAG TPA: hypothetical protein [Caudoviricetes sp.]